MQQKAICIGFLILMAAPVSAHEKKPLLFSAGTWSMTVMTTGDVSASSAFIGYFPSDNLEILAGFGLEHVRAKPSAESFGGLSLDAVYNIPTETDLIPAFLIGGSLNWWDQASDDGVAAFVRIGPGVRILMTPRGTVNLLGLFEAGVGETSFLVSLGYSLFFGP